MWTLSHLACEGVLTKTHSNSSHLASCEASFDQKVTPFVHLLFPVRELGGNDLGDVLSYLWWALSNSPEETPFCIEVRGEFRLRHVFRSETVEDMLVVSSALLPLWGYSGLEVVLRFAINKLLSLVVPS